MRSKQKRIMPLVMVVCLMVSWLTGVTSALANNSSTTNLNWSSPSGTSITYASGTTFETDIDITGATDLEFMNTAFSIAWNPDVVELVSGATSPTVLTASAIANDDGTIWNSMLGYASSLSAYSQVQFDMNASADQLDVAFGKTSKFVTFGSSSAVDIKLWRLYFETVGTGNPDIHLVQNNANAGSGYLIAVNDVNSTPTKMAFGLATNTNLNSSLTFNVQEAAATTPITAIAAITGTAQVGSVLTAGALTPSGATATYQWQEAATAGGTYANISGATSGTYTPVAADATKFIKVVATGTGSYSGTATSAATGAVAAASTTITGVAITGTAQVGSALTASLTPSSATATYVWQESATSGGTYTPIASATSGTYRPVAGDATKFIKVVATGTGSYSGTATSAAAGPVTAQVTPTGTISITPVALNVATAGQSYTQTAAFKASKGTYTYSYNSSSGTGLPAGLSFSSTTNMVSGIPTEAGSFTFEIDATNTTTNAVSSSNHTLTVKAPTIAIKGTLGTVTESVPFNIAGTPQITATETGNSSAVITFSEIGTLPSGISLTTAGAVYGTATAAGSFPFFVTATDGNGFTASKSFTLTVKAPAIKITATLPAALEGAAYSGSISAKETGYTGTINLNVGLPMGCGLSSSGGSISGTPTTTGVIPIIVTASDGNGYSITTYFTLTVKSPNLKITATLPVATAGAAYTPTKGTNGFTAKDAGNKNATFQYMISGLPTGLQGNEMTGAVSGAPTVAGNFTIQVVATEVLNGVQALTQAYGTFSLTVKPPTISFKTATVTSATAGSSYSGATFAAQESTNSNATFTYTEFGLPSWLTGATGNGTLALSGSVPAQAAGSYSLLITAKDNNNFSFTKSFTLTVKAAK